jgi:hypothetical protein
MATATGFHAHLAQRKLREILHHLFAAELLRFANNRLTIAVYPVDLHFD